MKTNRQDGKKFNLWQEISVVVGVSLIIGIFLRFFVIGVYTVPTGSMLNTIQEGETVFTSGSLLNLITDNDKWERGDIVVFHDEAGWLNNTEYEGETLVKRIIGLPGEKISGDGTGTVYINGIPLQETYVATGILSEGGLSASEDVFYMTLGPDEYWVMGDNRSWSLDSRRYGPISAKDIESLVIYQFNIR